MLDTQIRQRYAVFTLVELTLFRPLTVCVFPLIYLAENKRCTASDLCQCTQHQFHLWL